MADVVDPAEIVCGALQAEGLPPRASARLTIALLDKLRLGSWQFVHATNRRELISYRAGAAEAEASAAPPEADAVEA
ncbi:hypothetical protein [Methylopila sp. 73B]|uniref:hypothetical protein n=1 Tax=Methylopila sp. 73B TaxID=1120792 RepID=UPI0003783B3F|nr:hypothetical protein [Methylopila sp. 73B]